MRKSAVLLVVLIFAFSSLIMVKPASSEITKPSVPQFTLKYVDNSYDVPPVSSVDPYTGNNGVTQAGYHVQNQSVELVIENQPFLSYHDENGAPVFLFYYVDVKGNFENWATQDPVGYWMAQKLSESFPAGFIASSDSEQTVITYGLGGDNGTDSAYLYRAPSYGSPFYYGYYDYTLRNVSVGGKVDFRVQAVVGYSTRINETFSGPPIGLDPGNVPHYYLFTGQTSGWSSTETISIPDGLVSISTSPNPTSSSTASVLASSPPATTPYEPETHSGVLLGLSWEQVVIAVLAVAVVLLIFTVVYLRKRS